MELVGMTVSKAFPGFGTFAGVVESYDAAYGYFRINYEDGDSEDVDFEEISSILRGMGEHPPPEPAWRRSGRGRRPKKRRRGDLDPAGDGEEGAGEGLEGSEALVRRAGDFEGNGGRSADFREVNVFPGVSSPMEGLAGSTRKSVEENSLLECPETTQMDGLQSNTCIANLELSETREDLGDGEMGAKKRRRGLESQNSTPGVPLRRSSRRASAAFQSPPDSDPHRIFSDSPSNILEGKQADLDVGDKPALPPSSSDLNIEGLALLDLFSVYTFLRSFSRLLFLSPFSLEAFVAALRCRFANSLTDAIFFSILQTLKPHLEFLSKEGSQSAANCLRNLNWELLDPVTWPVYLAEYLLLHGSGMRSGLKLSKLKLLNKEFYKHPPEVKLEVLHCLCDDAMEVGSIRSEINRRMLDAEFQADSNRNMNAERKRKDYSGIDLERSSLMQDLCEGSADGNSDDCWLCGMDGVLLCCDGCPAAFHSRCVGVAKDLLPEGDWYCPECVVIRCDGLAKLLNSSQGAEILGIDPHGRLYFGCSDCLLVCDTYCTVSLYHYYNRKDLVALVKVLKTSNVSYGSITDAVIDYWEISRDALCSSDLCHLDAHEKLNATLSLSKLDCTSDGSFKKMERENLASPEHSDLIQSNTACLDSSDGMNDSRKCVQISEQNMTDSIDCSSMPNEDLMKRDLSMEQEKHIILPSWGCSSYVTKQGKDNASQMHYDPRNYINYFSFGRIASTIADELMHKFSESNNSNESKKPLEDIRSTQLKAISRQYGEFSWYYQKASIDVQKEKCGWCYTCKTCSDEDCLFKFTELKHPESSKKKTVGLRSEKNKRTHIFSAIHHILWLEDRIRAFLSGPWEKPYHSKQWRKAVSRAFDVATLKHHILTLESNLRRIAFSAEWVKPVDSTLTVGSSSYQSTDMANGSLNCGGNRKNAKKFISRAECGFLTSGLYWWRGGRLSRQVFQWKMLPRSLISKYGRQAGGKKIPGIFYPDGLEFAKRSKYVYWRAAVEMSESIAQLVYHVKDFHANIRWSELSNSRPLPQLTKESRKAEKLFKKVIIRRRCTEGTKVKYLLDFGKRETIPPIVTRHGIMAEDSSMGRKKYWLHESYVPLNLLKAFEERKVNRLLRKADNMLSEKADNMLSEKDIRSDMKKPRGHKGLSYLFSRQAKLEKQLCGHCNEDVFVREAVNCQYCNGYFHRKHFRVLKGVTRTTYTCWKCKDDNSKKIKAEESKQKAERQNISTCKQLSEKAKNGKREQPVKIAKKGRHTGLVKVTEKGNRKQPVKITKKRKNIQPAKVANKGMGITKKHIKKSYGLRSSSQGLTNRGSSEKSEIDIISPKRKRTSVGHSYWLNGLRWSRKADDEQGRSFRQSKILLPFQQTDLLVQCCLCHNDYSSEVAFIACENCGDWFHGDVFGLDLKNINNLIGFICHKCRNKSIPICPLSNSAAVGTVESGIQGSIGEGNNDVKDLNDEDRYLANFNEGNPDVIHDEDCWGEEGREDVLACAKEEMILNHSNKSTNSLSTKLSLEHAESGVAPPEDDNGVHTVEASSGNGDG